MQKTISSNYLMMNDIERSIMPEFRDMLPAFKGMGFDSFNRMTMDDKSIYSRATEQEARQSWGNDFSDPRNHNSNSFRYIVHGLIGDGARIHQHLAMAQQRSFDSSQNIDLLQDPIRVAEKKVISTSVIDQDHNETWGNVGLLLNVPFENVIAAYREDAGTPFFEPDKAVSQKKKIPTVSEILQATSKGSYNEVVLTGTTEAGKVQVGGFWARVFEDGQPKDPDQYKQIKELAQRHGLPFVEIVDKIEGFKDAPPDILEDISKDEPYCFATNRNGNRYLLDFRSGRFNVYDAKRQSHDMTREEFLYSLSLLGELSPEQNTQLADVIRKLPDQFAEAEYRRENPLPTVLKDINSDQTYGFAVNRRGKRFVIDIRKGEMYKVEKVRSTMQMPRVRSVYGLNSGDDDYTYKHTDMTQSDFAYIKEELAKDLTGEDLDLFNEMIPQLQSRFKSQ